ncbi:MAG: hypothetical protein IKG21_13420 [Atopobiaceae bacterium]|nr:hypothetical protein [Atopobiaceae bacterium]
MRGTHVVSIGNRRVRYRFNVRRNITIVRGDSGTGKTTLYDLVVAHMREGENSRVQLSCDKQCVALTDFDWKHQLAGIADSIVFVDEGSRFVSSEEFAAAVLGTDNYYVVFSREPLHQLPYSVDEIYYIKTSGKYHSLEPMYKKRVRHVYGVTGTVRAAYQTLLTEDSKSGYEFYKARFIGSDLTCVSAYTNSGIYPWLRQHANERVFVIADGAAFGSEAERVLALQERHANTITICLPESFEWLLLSSGLVGGAELGRIMRSPGDHIESQRFASWEQYFTALLTRESQGTAFAYSKGRLASAWTIKENADKVMAFVRNRNVK